MVTSAWVKAAAPDGTASFSLVSLEAGSLFSMFCLVGAVGMARMADEYKRVARRVLNCMVVKRFLFRILRENNYFRGRSA